ncbi:hypothetical protein GCM10019059_15960 [Camelimonas fluminis]|uniref:Uncharacterized protein n=1 Tax=Camelimonas fluminis TaxID=1576911 RepID=A0ABV7ULV4_9HYPH|nr:hypothetical protein [Camelimonas fluminis]GHE57346.1 hypothetical protein GCM10019059_15960 [Camelimonas fluminis]
MRLLKCVICIAIVYALSPVNGLTERETLDGLAKAAIAAQSTLPEARKAAAIVATGGAEQAGLLNWLMQTISPRKPAPSHEKDAPGRKQDAKL